MLRILDGQAGNDSVKGRVRPNRQSVAEIEMNERELIFGGCRLKRSLQLADGTFIYRRAIGGNDERQRSPAFRPEPAGKLSAAAAQVEPLLSRSRIEPRDRIREQPFVRRHFLLPPKRA